MKIKGFALAALIAVGALPFQAASYPTKPVRVVVGFAPGGNVDIVNRIVAQAMGDDLKQTFLVENRAGANGAIGAEHVARAAPDGYTLYVAAVETHALNSALRKSLPYDPIKDFTSVGLVGEFAYALVVNAKMPANNVAGFIAYAKQNPGKLNFSSWGTGSLSQIAMERLKQSTGTDLLHVPFKGAGPAMTALMSGSIQAFIAPLSLAIPYSSDGRVKMIAVTSAKRQEVTPNTPTLMEQGIPVDIAGWNILTAPAGTPKEVVAVLNHALNKAIMRPDVREKLVKLGANLSTLTPQETQAMVVSAHRQWGEVTRKAGIIPE